MSFEIPDRAMKELAEQQLPLVEQGEFFERKEGEPLPLPSGPPLSNPDADDIGKFRADPKPTELKAAVAVYPRTGSQRRRVLDAIAEAGERGLTNEEIGKVPGIADTAHRTRRKELVEGGWVEDSGRVRASDSGNDSIIWVLTERGRAKYGA